MPMPIARFSPTPHLRIQGLDARGPDSLLAAEQSCILGVANTRDVALGSAYAFGYGLIVLHSELSPEFSSEEWQLRKS